MAAKMLYDFANEIEVGDIVLARKGLKKILAVGKVTGKYFIDESIEKGYYHKIPVEWEDKEYEIEDGQLSRNTLVAISADDERIANIVVSNTTEASAIPNKISSISDFLDCLEEKLDEKGDGLYEQIAFFNSSGYICGENVEISEEISEKVDDLISTYRQILSNSMRIYEYLEQNTMSVPDRYAEFVLESSRRAFYEIYWDEYDGGLEAFENEDDDELINIINYNFDEGMNIVDEICLFPNNRQIFSDGRLDEVLELQEEFFQDEI
jgi:hypothetical protein